MFKTLVEEFNANKDVIFKRALIIGGAILGAVVLGKVFINGEQTENEETPEILIENPTVVELELPDLPPID